MTQTVRTAEVADRRTLQFRSLEDLRTEVDAITIKPLRVTGNWSAGQILQHVARLMEFSLDGFPMTAPWPIRMIGRLIRNRMINRPMRPGFRLPARADALLPDPGISLEQGAAALRACLDRIAKGEQMTQPSPIFGRLTHEQWIQLHLRHCEMHLSFIHFRAG